MSNTNQLTGSEKQIACASQIRTTFIAAFSEIKATCPTENLEKAKPMFDALQSMADVTISSWWIENRAFLEVSKARELGTATLPNFFKGVFRLP